MQACYTGHRPTPIKINNAPRAVGGNASGPGGPPATGPDHTTIAAHIRALWEEGDQLIDLIENDRGLQGDPIPTADPRSGHRPSVANLQTLNVSQSGECVT